MHRNDSDNSDFSVVELSDTESLLATSQYAKVIFHNVAEKYQQNQDLECHYSSQTRNFCTQPGDRIVLYKLGWQCITEYELFEWAQSLHEKDRASVIFEADNLPKNTNEFYQFCYVNVENSICGASVPFQFTGPALQTQSLKIDSSSTLCERDCDEIDSCPIVQKEAEKLRDKTQNIRKYESDCLQCAELTRQKQRVDLGLSLAMAALERGERETAALRREVSELREELEVTRREFRTRLDTVSEHFQQLAAEKRRWEHRYERLAGRCETRRRQRQHQETAAVITTIEDEVEELLPFPPLPLLPPLQNLTDKP